MIQNIQNDWLILNEMPKITINVIPNLQEMAIQLFVTFMAIYLIRRKYYNVIKNYFSKQNNYIRAKITNAIEHEKEANNLKKEQAEKLKAANQQYQQSISTAQQKASQIANEIIEKANLEGEKLKELKIAQANTSIEKAQKELTNETIMLAEKMLDKLLEDNKAILDKKLTNEIVNGL